MPTLAENPFAILTAVVAPAVLTNACSVLSLGTGNRIARVVDRTRAIAVELAKLESGAPEYGLLVGQLERMQVRAQMLIRALRNFYASLGSFAATALLSVIGSAFVYYDQHPAFQAAAVLGFGTGIFGTASLVAGCVIMVRETRLAVQNLVEDAQLTGSRIMK